jgi:hypothetical protein
MVGFAATAGGVVGPAGQGKLRIIPRNQIVRSTQLPGIPAEVPTRLSVCHEVS